MAESACLMREALELDSPPEVEPDRVNSNSHDPEVERQRKATAAGERESPGGALEKEVLRTASHWPR